MMRRYIYTWTALHHLKKAETRAEDELFPEFTDEVMREANPVGSLTLDEEGEFVVVSQVEDYLYRAPELADFNLMEFSCLFAKVTKEPVVTNEQGRRGNACYDFQFGHPQRDTHHMRLLNTPRIPFLGGKVVLRYPVNNPTFDSQAERWAAYFIALLAPYDLESKRPLFPLTMAGIQQWICSLDLTNTVDSGRLQYLQNCSDAAYSNENERFAIRYMRDRCATTYAEFDRHRSLSGRSDMEGPAKGPSGKDIQVFIDVLRASFEAKEKSKDAALSK